QQSKLAISEQEIDRRKGGWDEAKGTLKQALAALDNAELNYGWCTVVAPISGLANRHYVDVANLVTQDVTILTNIVSPRPTWAYFDVDQNTAERYKRLVREGKVKSVKEGQIPVEMGLTTDTGLPHHGDIDFVSNQLDPNTGSIRLRAIFPNIEGGLA